MHILFGRQVRQHDDDVSSDTPSAPPAPQHALTLAGHAVLAGAEEDEQSQLGADEAFAGPRWCRKDQIGHGVGRRVDPPQAGAADPLSTRDGLQALQPATENNRRTMHLGLRALALVCTLVPVLLREALDELQHAAVRHQVQRTLALVVGVADVSPFLR